MFVLDKRLVSFFRQTTGLLLHQQSLHSFCEQEGADGSILSAWMEQTGGALSNMHSNQSKTLRCGPEWVIFRLFGRKKVTGERKGMWKISEKRRRKNKQRESNKTGKYNLEHVRRTIYIYIICKFLRAKIFDTPCINLFLYIGLLKVLKVKFIHIVITLHYAAFTTKMRKWTYTFMFPPYFWYESKSSKSESTYAICYTK